MTNSYITLKTFLTDFNESVGKISNECQCFMPYVHSVPESSWFLFIFTECDRNARGTKHNQWLLGFQECPKGCTARKNSVGVFYWEREIHKPINLTCRFRGIIVWWKLVLTWKDKSVSNKQRCVLYVRQTYLRCIADVFVYLLNRYSKMGLFIFFFFIFSAFNSSITTAGMNRLHTLVHWRRKEDELLLFPAREKSRWLQLRISFHK